MCTVEPQLMERDDSRSDGPLLSNCPLSCLFHYDLLNSVFVSVGKLLKMMLLKRNHEEESKRIMMKKLFPTY